MTTAVFIYNKLHNYFDDKTTDFPLKPHMISSIHSTDVSFCEFIYYNSSNKLNFCVQVQAHKFIQRPVVEESGGLNGYFWNSTFTKPVPSRGL